MNTPPGIWGKADAIGYAVCHRIDLRSFHIGIRQFPLCARCTGQYLGIVAGIVIQLIYGKRNGGKYPRWLVIIMVLFALAYAIDGVNSYLHLFPIKPKFLLYEPNNTFRLLTGSGFGLAIGLIIMPVFHQSMWKQWSTQPPINSFLQFFVIIAVLLSADLSILFGVSALMIPLALLSAAGVLLILTLVYSMLWVLLLNLENSFEDIKSAGFVMLAGLITALVQIIVFDIIRYSMFGTWAGFIFK